jgi:hypothetical protein
MDDMAFWRQTEADLKLELMDKAVSMVLTKYEEFKLTVLKQGVDKMEKSDFNEFSKKVDKMWEDYDVKIDRIRDD